MREDITYVMSSLIDQNFAEIFSDIIDNDLLRYIAVL